MQNCDQILQNRSKSHNQAKSNQHHQWIATLSYYKFRPSALLKLHEAGFYTRPFLGGVECSNGGFRPCEDLAWQESVVYWWTALSPPPPTLNPFVSTCDTTLLIQLLRFSILFGGKLYKQLQVLEVA